MKDFSYLTLAFIFLFCVSCSNVNGPGISLRQKMMESYKYAYPDDGVLLMTHFKHIGNIEIKNYKYHVCEIAYVRKEMLAPRGQTHIAFFDRHMKFKYRWDFTYETPLWCDGHNIFISGYAWQRCVEPFGVYGNVWDLSFGYEYENRRLLYVWSDKQEWFNEMNYNSVPEASNEIVE